MAFEPIMSSPGANRDLIYRSIRHVSSPKSMKLTLMQKRTASRNPMPRTADAAMDQMTARGATVSALLVSSENCIGLRTHTNRSQPAMSTRSTQHSE